MTTSGISLEPVPSSRRAARSGILERLKQETAADHAAIEAATNIMSPRLGLDEYRAYLASSYGYYVVVEPQLRAAGVWTALQLPAAERQKLPLLRRDLRALGVPDVARLPSCAEPPQWDSVAEAVGGAYVLEGSTLGGRVISRHVQQRLGGAVPSAFLDCYGTRTSERWQAFRAALWRFASSREIEDRIVAGARSTFRTFTGWLARSRSAAAAE